MRRDGERGVVWLDESRCIGCWMCVLGCPVGALSPSPANHRPIRAEATGLARDLILDPRALARDVQKRRSNFSVTGWGWRGIDSFPAARSDCSAGKVLECSPTSPVRYVIVGAGVAAARAVEAIRERDSAGTITLVSDESHTPYSRVLLPKYVAGHVSEKGLRLHEPSWWHSRGVQIVLGDGARGLDCNKKVVLLTSGNTIAYDRLLIATGAHAVMPDGLPGVNLSGVETLHDLKGAAALSASEASRAVVVGGGFVAIKAAEALKARGLHVTIVVRSRLFRRSLDAKAAQLVRVHLSGKGIDVIEGVDLSALYGSGRVEGVALTDGRHLPSELVVLGAGVKASAEWLAGSDVKVRGGVVVDHMLRTTAADVWAAGDVAETVDVITGRPTLNAIWPAAAEQGRIAGANMAGEDLTFDGSLAMNTLDLLGLPVAAFGEPDERGRTECREGNNVYESRFYRDGRLSGAVLVGDITECGRLLAEARRQALVERTNTGRTACG